MKLTEADASFLDAVSREFAFLSTEHGFRAEEPEWDDNGLRMEIVR